MSLFKRNKKSVTGSSPTSEKKFAVMKSINKESYTTFDPQKPLPEISDREVEILKDCWKIVQQNVAEVGIIMYVGLFETHQEVHDAFMSFRAVNTSDLEYNAILRAHALRLMGTIGKFINRLDNNIKLQELVTDLGTCHNNYSLKIKYMDVSIFSTTSYYIKSSVKTTRVLKDDSQQ